VSYTLSLYTGCGDKNRANSGNGISGQNLSLCRTLPLQERGQRTLLFSFWPSRVSCLENDHVTAARLQLADHSSIRWALASRWEAVFFPFGGPLHSFRQGDPRPDAVAVTGLLHDHFARPGMRHGPFGGLELTEVRTPGMRLRAD